MKSCFSLRKILTGGVFGTKKGVVFSVRETATGGVFGVCWACTVRPGVLFCCLCSVCTVRPKGYCF